MKIFTEFNLAIWLRMVKFTELNISEFWFLNSNFICYHWDILKKSNDKQNSNLVNLQLAKWRNLNSNKNFLAVGYFNFTSIWWWNLFTAHAGFDWFSLKFTWGKWVAYCSLQQSGKKGSRLPLSDLHLNSTIDHSPVPFWCMYS